MYAAPPPAHQGERLAGKDCLHIRSVITLAEGVDRLQAVQAERRDPSGVQDLLVALLDILCLPRSGEPSIRTSPRLSRSLLTLCASGTS
jgi:hypothetical protein